ncbi:MAG TPA: hypothetical protein PLO93_03625, partial [Candidatus Omnitrophota bacterium]|nr:hypothetical protein [Candidatus Omnitrophota bacterium]
GSDRAEDFALLRCAELSLENGYKYFIIIDEKLETQTTSTTTPVTANTYGRVNMYGNQGSYSGTTYYSGGETYTFHKPSASNTIKCFKDKPQDSNMMVYDAEQIKQNIRKQYKLDEEAKEESVEVKTEAPKPTQNF